ncbi:uncharacterized protein PAC_20155 [Phialocephala subalpina]|uniref:C2H2-type domain-containing protein n=1 Tax=Phialocephala subalpina TaxID=576137 RepID=A0A1L7XZ08_9HELO|nr:uncharacterized protein PAC_20155 [Phialocephala subalpina]
MLTLFMRKLLEKDSPLISDDEILHIIDDDIVEDSLSIMGSLKNLGETSSRRSSLGSHLIETQSTLATSTGTLELFCCGGSNDGLREDFNTPTRRISAKPRPELSASYFCLFCFDQFGSEEDWEAHECSRHIATQSDWICMPWGATEKLDTGEEVCIFCGVVAPNTSHSSQHKDDPCHSRSVSRRTYTCKESLQEHLQEVHNHYTMTDRMEKWSFSPPADDDWYWGCGFCKRSIVGWTDRVRHIGRHFRQELSMSSWDPFVPACPIDRNTGMIVTWPSESEVNRRKHLAALVKQLGFIIRYECQMCPKTPFTYLHTNAIALRHEDLWHLPRHVWLCLTKSDARSATHFQTGPLASYFFPNTLNSLNSNKDICPYCDEYLEDVFFEMGEDIDDCLADWEIRMEHLESEHNFDKCSTNLVL